MLSDNIADFIHHLQMLTGNEEYLDLAHSCIPRETATLLHLPISENVKLCKGYNKEKAFAQGKEFS